jgi:hypothetical protein
MDDMSQFEDLAKLSKPELDVLGLWMITLRQQALIKLHQALLEQLLAPKLNGRSLESVYAKELEEGMQRALAETADSDPIRASRVAKLLILCKKAQQ